MPFVPFVCALQEKLTREVCGTKGMKSSDGKALPANTFLGHFLKPYFKDKTSGIVSIGSLWYRCGEQPFLPFLVPRLGEWLSDTLSC